MELLRIFCCCISLLSSIPAIPVGLLYDYNVQEAIRLSRENDVSSDEIKLKVPIVFYGTKFKSIFVNSNGLLSFQTEIANFFNIEFPLDYPLIAPFYSNVDTREAGVVSYYETNNSKLISRATENVREYFSDQDDFQAKSLFIVTWRDVGYYKRGNDKTNTYQVVIINDGVQSFVEILYPKGGIQWIQGTGDESGLPDARAQAGFISADGKIFTLPGSGTEQVRNLELWSNIDLPGQFIYRVDGNEIQPPDLITDEGSEDGPLTCADAPTYCHVQARCVDYEDGFCCQCKQQYYGNGRFCVKKDVPLRVNGKVNGRINGERLDNLDLQSYIVMTDGRVYTAISKIPESIGFDIQSLQILGGVIGYVFAKPIRNAQNGYQFTGGVFNQTAVLRFLNTSQTVTVTQKYLGLDVFDQLRLETNIQGEIPALPYDSRIIVDEYQEQYTQTAPDVIQMSSTRSFKYINEKSEEVTVYYDIEQVYTFDYCKFQNATTGATWRLKVGKNFISYESKEQIIRFGMTNKIMPLEDADPCEEGRSHCMVNSACVVDNDSFRCVCNPGYQQLYSGNATVCADVDECQSGTHTCDYNAQCINEIGSYSCRCNPGFRGNGQVCENEFSCQNVICPPNSECVESNRVAMCRCLQGFTGDGQTCTALVDQSCHTVNNCDQFAVCTINQTTNSYFCSCLPGFAGDGYRCRKVEIENVTEITRQREVQRCLLGVCWCPEGYAIEQGSSYCIPKDQTTIAPPETTTVLENITCNVLNNCHRDAQCVFSPEDDSFYCQCNLGFVGDGYSCEKSSVSCAQVYNCGANANCFYDESVGKSKCVCNPGYQGDGFNCTITAMCTSNSNCTATEECLYTSSERYECVCKEGFVRDSQKQCVKPSTCGGGTCVENAECLYDDEYQLYYCSCKSGYIGDGITECKPRPVGCNVQNNCGLHATCEYDPSTALYQCQCLKGFYGDGYVCYTEINCHVDPALCDPQATCVTDANRRYICQCNIGYSGNGTLCRRNPTHEGNFLLMNQGMATLKIPLEASKKDVGKPIQIKLFQTAVGLDIDCFEGRVYWSDISGMAIRTAAYNGSAKADFITQEIGSPEGIAVDWVSRNIYWTDSTKDTIEVASIEGRRRRVLVNSDLVNPRGIAVHPQRGKIFWTDWDRKNPKIEWANADGSGRAIFLRGDSVSLPNSLTVDFETEHLCYADAGTKKIECVDIDTKVKRTIAANCTYPFGVTVTDKHIYWSDWISKKIERVDKSTLERLPPMQVPLGGSGNKLYELVAVPQSCPTLTNVCQYYKDQCPTEHICLPNGSGSRTCACTFDADNPSERPSCTL